MVDAHGSSWNREGQFHNYEMTQLQPHWKNKTNKEKLDLAIQILSTTDNQSIHSACQVLSSLLIRDFITLLPLELSLCILGYMDLITLYHLLVVNKRYNQICQDNSIWKTLYFRNGFVLNPLYLYNYNGKLSGASSYMNKDSVELDWKDILRQRLVLQENWNSSNYSTFCFQAHFDAVYTLQFDSEKLITGSGDHTIKVWDLESKTCIQTLYGHSGSVLCLQFDSEYLVSGSSDCSILIWSLLNGMMIRKLLSHSDSVLSIKFNRQYVFSCSKDCTIKVWDFSSGTLLKTLVGHVSAVNAIEYSHGLIVSASGDRTIRIWQVASGKNIRTIHAHSRGIASIQFDGSYIVTGSSDGIHIWDVNAECFIHTLTGHVDLVRSLQLSTNSVYPERNRILSGSYDGQIKLWDLNTWKEVTSINHFVGGNGKLFKVQFDSVKIIASLQNGQVIIYDFTRNVDDVKLFI